MKRRDFLKSSLAAGAIGMSVDIPGLIFWGALPVIQLFTDESTAQFRVLVPISSDVVYEASEFGGRSVKIQALSRTLEPFTKADAIDHLIVTGLNPLNRYQLTIRDKKTRKILDQRGFSAVDLSRKNARVAFVSCMSDTIGFNRPIMWDSLRDSKPDLIFFTGDTCYADFGGDGTPKSLWRRHLETRRKIDVYRWKNLIPILATWDDHDYGVDDANKNNPIKAAAHSVFKALFSSINQPQFETGLGTSSVVQAFGQNFILMDNRSERDPVGTVKGSHWGYDQEQKVLKLVNSEMVPTWILNGGQIFGAYLKKDAVELENPEGLTEFRKNLSDAKAPVLFVSGDAHFSELMQLEKELSYPTIEITSSSIHSTNYKFQNLRTKNHRRVASAWQHNFVIADINSARADRGELSGTLTCVGANRFVYFKKSFSVIR